jgi:TetR/AcrR family transcriptional regulator
MVEKTIMPEPKVSRILDAAQKRFAHYGLAKTTMNDIADDLGISKAALYYYFPDKESIFKYVVQKEQADFCNKMEQLISSRKEIDTALTKYVEMRVEYFKKLINLGQLTYDSFHAAKPLYAELGKVFFERETEIIKKLLEQASERKEIMKIDIEEHAIFFVRVLCSLRLYILEKRESWEQGNLDSKVRQEYSLFTQLFLKGIK